MIKYKNTFRGANKRDTGKSTSESEGGAYIKHQSNNDQKRPTKQNETDGR